MTNRAIIAAILSAGVTTTVWCLAWPHATESELPASAVEKQPISADRSKVDVSSILSGLKDAKTTDEKLTAAGRINRVPVEEIPQLLEEIPLKDGHRLSFPLRALLIRWASKDGPAAMNWVWQKFPSEIDRNSALREIGASWAWHDPAGLGKWAEQHMSQKTDDASSAVSTTPAISPEIIDDICLWIAPHDPYLACMLRKQAPIGFSSQDVALPQAIPTVEKVRDALRAYDNLDQLSSTKISGNQFVPLQLLRRWQELDPEDFSRSPYGHIMPPSIIGANYLKRDEWRTMPVEERGRRANSLIAGKEQAGREMGVYNIAGQWAEVDPAATADWLESLPEFDAVTKARVIAKVIAPKDLSRALSFIDSLEPHARRSFIVHAFDGWTKQHPDARANLSGQNMETLRIWQDLESLRL